jgi:hypothetical protein
LSLKVSARLNAKVPTISVLKVEADHPDGILVTFSDGTFAGYVVEELLLLRPIREDAGDLRGYTSPPKPAD